MEGDSSAKASPPNKRGYLSYEKCTFCRKDKKKVSVLWLLILPWIFVCATNTEAFGDG